MVAFAPMHGEHPSADESGPAPDDEAQLVARLRAGDDAAFEDLVRTHAGRMLAVARRMLRTEEDAQDAVQDAFFSAFRAMERFEGGSRLSTWLHRIVVNAALMKLRTRRRKPEEPLDPVEPLLPKFLEDGHMLGEASAWQAPSDLAMEQRELRELVLSKIHELPETYRTVLLLRDVEELDTEETAEALGVSTGAVKTRLHRARQALRTLLDPYFRVDA